MGSISARIRRSRAARLVSKSPSRVALVGTILGSAPGFLLPYLVAQQFHVGRITDAYFLTYDLVMVMTGVLVAAVEANTLPVAKVRLRGGRSYFRAFIRRTAGQAAAIAAVAYMCCALASIAYLYTLHGWTDAQRTASEQLLAVFAVLVVLIGTTSVLDASLYALDDYGIPTLSVALRSLIPLATIWFIPHSYQGVLALAVGLVVGEMLRALWLLQRLRRRTHALPTGEVPHVPSVWSTAGPHALSLSVSAASPLIDRAFAATLAIGSVTLLDLGERVYYVPMTIIANSFVLVAGSRWAASIIDDPDKLRQDFSHSVRRGLTLSSAFAAVMMVGLALVPLVFGTTAVGAPSHQLALVSIILVAGTPPGTIGYLGARLLTVSRRTRWLPLLSLTYLVANGSLDYVGSRTFGLYGIAAASTLARILSAGAYLACARYLLSARGATTASVVPAD